MYAALMQLTGQVQVVGPDQDGRARLRVTLLGEPDGRAERILHVCGAWFESFDEAEDQVESVKTALRTLAIPIREHAASRI